MNLSMRWLSDYVTVDVTPKQYAEDLTMSGSKVEGYEVEGSEISNVVVGKVLSIEKHPDADKLVVCQVDVGGSEPIQIVTGATNVVVGALVPACLDNSTLPGGKKIKKGKLRGVLSQGMMCSLGELGLTVNDFPYAIEDGIFLIEEDCYPGQDIQSALGLNDTSVEFEITSNRPDCMSVIGLARETAATYHLPLQVKPPQVKGAGDGDHISNYLKVSVENPELCPRYTAKIVKNVKIGPSPRWMRERLRASGVRPINNIVDITNYIVHATGQPLHCFDADKVGSKVIVKTMPSGTPFKTLDGVERKLDEHDLMICNENGPMCIGGVFGGEESGVTENTVNVFIESAYFHPTWIRKTARRHGLSTDASFRNERGIDPLRIVDNLKLAASLVKELAGGTISSDIKLVNPVPFEKFKVELTYEYTDKLIGKKLPHDMIKSIVKSLEMEIVEETEEGLKLLVPPYRVDVQRPCDVIEDILRIYGYNNVEIPSSLKSSITVKGEEDKSVKLQNLVAEQLVGQGFNEIMNNSLTPSAYYDGLESYKSENLVRLINPLSNDLNVMRQTLLFGGLESISHNINHKNSNIRFFEFGNCYYFNESKRNAEQVLSPYSEDMHMGIWMSGKRVTNSWAHAEENTSFYELKANVENILVRVGIDLHKIAIEKCSEDIFSAGIVYKTQGGKVLVKAGIVAKKLLKKLDISQEVVFADINWDILMKAIKSFSVSFREISKYPAVRRDLALLLDSSVQFEDIRKVAFETERKLLKEVSLFDVYEGKNLEAGKKSYAMCFILQDENNTLTDKQIDKVMNKLISTLQTKFDAKLR